jgi:hypothetical protein
MGHLDWVVAIYCRDNHHTIYGTLRGNEIKERRVDARPHKSDQAKQNKSGALRRTETRSTG